ncbi:RDD family protein [Haloferula rosea]|uniref:RDD family protein n=1 Tax=Haloferula rosea TaxID=490093 RepID=A0A934RB38_9BACT|nr:RDD family protein [Haloferula rosea]MBK1827752.1 RDD family protein [Haloferula rosea]
MSTEASQNRLDTLQPIELAEGVEVRLRIAGPLLRGGALGIDLAIQWAFILLAGFILSLTGMVVGGLTAVGLISLMWFFVWWWYPVFFEAGPWGATFGKKILGLRVVQKSGSPITFGQAVLRNFLRYADGMPFLGFGVMGIPTFGFGVGVLVATQRFQRLGDLAAGTVVIYDKVPPEPVVPSPPALETIAPPMALRPEEVKALSAFTDRAGLWSEGRRIEIADHARELSGSKGAAGVTRLTAMARWLQERK